MRKIHGIFIPILLNIILTFIIKYFCGDKYKFDHTLQFLNITDFKNTISGRGNNAKFQVMAYMKLFTKHKDREEVSEC